MIKPKEFAQELEALEAVFHAVEPLDEEKRSFVLSTVIHRLGVRIGFMGNAQVGGAGIPPTGQQQVGADTTPKLFLKNKHPVTDVQRIACLAHYLTHQRQTPHFKTQDLTALNTEAAGDKIGNAAQAVKNATNQNHFLSPAGKSRKQITALGEEVVNALPNQETVKAVIGAETAGRRRRRIRTGKKKKS
jgi:hypothetical protein